MSARSGSPSSPEPLADTFALRGRLLRGLAEPQEAVVVVAGGKVAAIERPEGAAPRSRAGTRTRVKVTDRLPRRWLDAAFIAPGFVDLQVNGAFGNEVGRDPDALRALATRLPRTGVTTFLPTLISATDADYVDAFAAFRAARMEVSPASPAFGARFPGLHLEGPFLATSRAGAHDRALIERATAAMVARLADPAIVRLVTLAPERPGALELIAQLKARGVTVALGHTDATLTMFTAGVDAGASIATHLFNAMSAFHHREPGAVGAALLDDRVTALLIADGVHMHPAAFRLAIRAKGCERLGLVTDAIAGAGLPPGRSTLAGRPVIVDESSARLVEPPASSETYLGPTNGAGASAGAGTLAGSILTMDRAVQNAVAFGGLSPAAAVYLATEGPARAGNLAHAGRLSVGGPADIVLLDERLTIIATFVNGVLCHGTEAAAHPQPRGSHA